MGLSLGQGVAVGSVEVLGAGGAETGTSALHFSAVRVKTGNGGDGRHP